MSGRGSRRKSKAGEAEKDGGEQTEGVATNAEEASDVSKPEPAVGSKRKAADRQPPREHRQPPFLLGVALASELRVSGEIWLSGWRMEVLCLTFEALAFIGMCACGAHLNRSHLNCTSVLGFNLADLSTRGTRCPGLTWSEGRCVGQPR
eukprot:3894681-Rhodomonas_salina.1